MPFYALILALLLGISGKISAQRIYFKTYTVMDGLVANPVRCIYQDSKGFIWIGTFEGLSRYDGFRFTNYTTGNGLSHNFINAVYETNNQLLIGENNGAVDVIQRNRVRRLQMLPGAVNNIATYDKRILLSTDSDGFYEYITDTVVQVSQQKTGTPLGSFTALNDSLLISDAVDRDIYVFTKNLELYAAMKNPDISYYAVFRDSKHRIWACSSAGLQLLNIPTRRGQPIAILPLPAEFNFFPLNNSQVTSMIEKDGHFWFGTSKGLVHISPDGTHSVFEEKDGLPSSYVQTLCMDREDNLWIGTTLGLAKWASRNSVHFYNEEDHDFRNDALSIYPLANRFLLNTLHGLQYFDLKANKFTDVDPGNQSAFIPINNTQPLLLYHAGHVSLLDESNNMIRPQIKLDTIISGINSGFRHPSGIIYLGSDKGLFAIKNNVVKQILPYRITSLAFDSTGNIWTGTWINGLFRIRLQSDRSTYEISNLTNLIQQQEIRSVYCQSSSNIWVGTRYGGAFCLTAKTGSDEYEVTQFNRNSGLISDWIKSIVSADNGDIWVGSYLGLDRLVKEGNTYRVFNFSKAVNFFAQIEQIVPAGHNEWICLSNTGIARFKDEHLHQSPPLQPSISWSLLGSLKDKTGIDTSSEKIKLKYNQNALRFEFSAPGFINEKHLLYSYRLTGTGDTSWSNPENTHEASYAGLAPGKYVFEVRTIGWNGQPGKTDTFTFVIQPPFWKTGWFYALCIILIGLALYALYRYRIRQLLKWQRTRDRIAADLHDDIGSSLTNISILSELSYKNLDQPQQAGKFLQRITEQIHDSSQAMDDIIWSVNSKNDSIEEIFARMTRFTTELFDSTNIEYELAVDDDIYGKKINMEQRRDVFLMYKEVLNNIYKHAAASNVNISVSLAGNTFVLHVQDNGVGFDASVASHRNGLKNLYQRSAKWDGNVTIQSAPGNGTDIKISLPLKS